MTVIDLDTLVLARGTHPNDPQCCIEEAAALWAGEPKHDNIPQCASLVIGRFLGAWNDWLDDADRQMLVPWVAKQCGTGRDPKDELAREWMCVDWSVRVALPKWLRLGRLDAHADTLEALAPLVDEHSWWLARPVVSAAEGAAEAAGVAEAALAAWACGAAWLVGAAWVSEASGAFLRPTVVTLQSSALDLLERMAAVDLDTQVPA